MASTAAEDRARWLHALQQAAVAQADQKASIAGGVELAALATAAARVAGADGPAVVAWAAALVCLAAAVALAGWAVLPRIRVVPGGPEDWVHFGHVVAWTPDRLRRALRGEDLYGRRLDPVEAVARQVPVVARIALAKHRRVRWSMQAAAVGLALAGVAALIP